MVYMINSPKKKIKEKNRKKKKIEEKKERKYGCSAILVFSDAMLLSCMSHFFGCCTEFDSLPTQKYNPNFKQYSTRQ